MTAPATLLATACALAVAVLVVAEWRRWPTTRVVCKLSASTLMVLVAVGLHATASSYGRLVLGALLLGAFGDACLLSERRRWFLSGLGLFLLAHVVYAAAFAAGGVSAAAFGVALVGASALGIATLRWLWRHLGTFDRVAVGAYVLAIVAMCSLAVGHGVAAHAGWVAAGALAFAASDIAVARDRFVAPGPLNRAWGLPLYYAAQLLLAASVA